MLRREFISVFAGAVITDPRVATAQTPSKIYRVGTLLPGAPLDEKSALGALLLKKLEQHGYALGKNLCSSRAERVARLQNWARSSAA